MQTFDQVRAQAMAGDPAAQELMAQVFEQSGQVDEAVAWLARAAKAGLPSAHARLGLWQVVGFGVAQAPADGVARILAAAGAGDPFGLNLAGILDAGGVGTPRDPARAVQWLARLAAGGDASAACQIGLLIGLRGPRLDLARAALSQAAAAGYAPAVRILGRKPPRATPVDWTAAAAAVDLSPFEGPIERRVERESPRVRMISDLLPDWACDYVMSLAEPALVRAKVVDDETGGEAVRDERSNRVMNFGLADSDVVLELINNRLAAAAEMPPENAEGLGVLHYAVGERYRPHVDYIADTPANAPQLAQRGQRVRTLLVYLNEGFEGGATEFPRLELAYRPPRGSALVFDSVDAEGAPDPMTLHTGAPPTRGEKWVISKWFRTKALRPPPA
ncbi:MAG: 2OG-Fe(II) oxygenase [Phenylobacterium sp.]|uniref:2OG-Fe(II) oxygenase n=1 Tax=Phenylobacterium sp. TaxID=1871053 RepID=UPI00391A0FC0